ncbi:hypothetical protein DY000_02038093 [Brassica cretica]|uniref:Uncharacterized protein n=1 Tax=Brassica cretica TaxID=69181 RepID=A0ABQ7BLH6_BRACR|nr:hypothetical protein DY000_02038093 [Brassica cretica]
MFPRRSQTEKTLSPPPVRSNESVKPESLTTAASGDSKSKKQNSKAVVSSADPAKCAGQPGDSLARAISGDSKSKKSNGKVVVSSTDPVKRARQHGVSLADSGNPPSKKLNGKAVVSASDEVLFFKDVKFGPREGKLRFRLVHFWEARNALTEVLFGLELLLIDGQGTVIQRFIPPNRIETYLPHMFAGSVYWLNNFYGSKSKSVYRVAEPDMTIAFTWNSVLSVLENSPLPTLMEAKKQSTQLNQPQQPPQQLAVSTAQPATSISTQGSSTSGVTNVYKLSKAELRRYQLTRIEEPE